MSLSSRDVGKRLETEDGDLLGWVDSVEGEGVYVKPKPELIDCYGSWITGLWSCSECYRLRNEYVEEVDEESVRLKTPENRIQPKPR